ncbi:threonine synthase [Streptomyces lydicus]
MLDYVSTQTFRLECTRCQWKCEPATLFRCPRCSGALESRTDIEKAALHSGTQPELVYFSLLPVGSAEFISEGISRTTPCRIAPRLGNAIGVPNLWVKDESKQPTGSTKDRLAAITIAVFRQFGIKEFVSASTGNTAISLARAVHNDASIQAHFFCGHEFVDRHRFPVNDRVKLTVVQGSYAEAQSAARAYSAQHGALWDGGFFNWARREGLKLAYLEAFDSMDAEPDVVVQAISSGMGVMAAHKGAAEYREMNRLKKLPRFLMVQQDTCAPMARAWQEGRVELTDDDVVENPDGLARAILLGDGRDTYPYMRDIAKQSDGAIVSVSQQSLVQARTMLCELEGLDVCYSSAATIAAVRDEAAAGRIQPRDVVLVNLTGR